MRQFITDHVESVMQLEALLLLAGHSGQARKSWTAADLAQQLRIDSTWVEAQLRMMAAGDIVGISQETPPQFRYEPRTTDLSQTIDELAAAYHDRRVTVIGLIFSKPIDKIRSFADAFRLRKDRSN